MTDNITIEYNGLTLGDGTIYNISNLDAGELPSRIAEQLASGRAGGYIFRVEYGMRIIAINVDIVGDNESELFNAIEDLRSAFGARSETLPLTINYWEQGRVRIIDAIPVLFPNPIHESARPDSSANIRIELKAPFPFYRSSTVEVAELVLSEAGGTDYPLDFPMSYVGGTSGNVYNFNNDGSVAALLKATFNGEVTNPTLINESNGTIFQIEATLLSSESVTGQFLNNQRSIKYNSGVSAESVFNGTTAFFLIPVGTNIFRFSASTYSASATCDLEFTKYYLS